MTDPLAVLRAYNAAHEPIVAVESPAVSWVSDEVRKYAVPDEFGRVSPFAVYVFYPETSREMRYRNLRLAEAEAMADREAAKGYRVHVSLDTCG